MKKIFGFLMAVAVLFTTSCAKEDISSNIATGDAVEVTFTANLPELGTRAYGDGLTATNLQYFVYEKNGNDLTKLNALCGTAGFTNRVAKVNLALIKGMTYVITFWADNNAAPYTFDGQQVTIDYTAVVANDENLDAFYGVKEFNPSVDTDTNVQLRRPFAQLNAIATDFGLVKQSGINVLTRSEVIVQGYNTLNLLDGKVSGLETITFDIAAIPEGTITDTNAHLAMNYVLVNEKELVEATFAFYGKHDANDTAEMKLAENTYTNIPVQRNYKTNIIGKLLTKATEFNVEILPDFTGTEEYEVVEVATANELQTALNNPEVAEIVLTTDITLDGTLTFGAPATRTAEALPGRNFVIDGNGNTLKVVKAGTVRVIDFTSATNGASLTLKNLTIENNVSWIERIVNYNTTGTLTIDNVKIINAEGCNLNYAINLPASSDESTVVINNSEIWANANALNLWGEETTVNITNSKLYVVDSNPTEGYSVISLNNQGENAAHNSVINIEGGEVKVIYEGEGETQPSSALRDATNGSVFNISETTVVVGEMKLPVANVLYEGYDQFYSFTTLGAAIKKAQEDNNGTVCLIKDITLSEPINIAADDFQVVIDLNGKTINAEYVEGSETNHVYAFENHGNIKITGNGTINARGIFNYGTLTLENGTINAIDGNGGYGVRNYEGATFTMNGGTIATTLEDDELVDKGGYDATTLRVDEGATAVINGGTITNICDYTFAIENHGDTTVKAGTFTSVHTNTANYGTLTIEGGSFTCNGLEGITAHALWAAEGTTTINGGTFDGKDNYNGFNVDASKGATVIIKGGDFLPVHSGSLYGDGTITVSGGTFFDKIPADRLASGYVSVEKDGKWTTKFEGKNVSTAAELIQKVAEVEDGDVIVLTTDITFTEEARTHNSSSWYDGLYYIGDKSFTIDLGGYTINQNGAVNDYLLNFKNDGEKANTITLKNGTVDAGTAAFCALCTSGTSTQDLTINTEDINFINNISNGATLKIRGAKTTVNIKAGTVITGVDSYLCIESYQATVNIYDGAELYQNGATSYNGCLVGVSGNGLVNVYGGYGKGKKGGFIAMTSGGTINVAGGEWIANTDGTIGDNSNVYVLTAQSNSQEPGFAGGSFINVTGGTFRGGMDAWVLHNDGKEKAGLEISGGNFNANPSNYLADGATATEANGIWTVK